MRQASLQPPPEFSNDPNARIVDVGTGDIFGIGTRDIVILTRANPFLTQMSTNPNEPGFAFGITFYQGGLTRDPEPINQSHHIRLKRCVTTFPHSHRVSTLLVADFNGDGTSNDLQLIFEDSSLPVTAGTTLINDFSDPGGSGFRSVDGATDWFVSLPLHLFALAADINSDGKDDIASFTTSGYIAITLNSAANTPNQNGSFPNTTDYQTTARAGAVGGAALHINPLLDARLDVAVITSGQLEAFNIVECFGQRGDGILAPIALLCLFGQPRFMWLPGT